MAPFSYWEERLKREGLGLYRAAPGKRTRFFFPHEEVAAPPAFSHEKEWRVDWARLSPREREVILRLFYDRHTEREASLSIGISRSSVRVYRRRALRKLKQKGGIVEVRNVTHPPGEGGENTPGTGETGAGVP